MSWQNEAECRKASDDSWFPAGNPGRQRRSRQETVRRAVAICKSCPVRAACADDALKRDVSVGIWAGVDLGDSGSRSLPPGKAAQLQLIAKDIR